MESERTSVVDLMSGRQLFRTCLLGADVKYGVWLTE